MGNAFSVQGHVTSVVIGDAAAKSTGSPENLNLGEVGLFLDDGQNTRVTESNAATAKTANTKMKFMWKDSFGKIRASHTFSSNATFIARQHTAPTQFTGYFGFNGSTGSITVNNSTEYRATINIRETITSSVNGSQVPNYSANFTSGAAAVQAGIAVGLTQNFLSQFSRRVWGPNAPFKFELMAPVTNDNALGTSVDSVTFTKGSKVVTATDIDDATSGTVLAADGYIRIGTNASDPVYPIESVDEANDALILKIPYQGETATFLDTALRTIAPNNVGSTDFGIKVSGVPMSDGEWRLNRRNYGVINAVLVDPSTYLGVSIGSVGDKGSGHQYEVAELESWGSGSNGGGDHILHGPNNYPQSKLVDGNLTINGYDLWSISEETKLSAGFSVNSAKKNITVAIPTDRGNDAVYADSGATDDISDCLEAYMNVIKSTDSSGSTLSSNKLEGTA